MKRKLIGLITISSITLNCAAEGGGQGGNLTPKHEGVGTGGGGNSPANCRIMEKNIESIKSKSQSEIVQRTEIHLGIGGVGNRSVRGVEGT